jgi:hypothetical protein
VYQNGLSQWLEHIFEQAAIRDGSVFTMDTISGTATAARGTPSTATDTERPERHMRARATGARG